MYVPIPKIYLRIAPLSSTETRFLSSYFASYQNSPPDFCIGNSRHSITTFLFLYYQPRFTGYDFYTNSTHHA